MCERVGNNTHIHSLGLPVRGNTSHKPGDITGRPGILPPEAGNVTVTVLLPAGPTVIFPAGGNIPAPFGNVTGWREYYRPAW